MNSGISARSSSLASLMNQHSPSKEEEDSVVKYNDYFNRLCSIMCISDYGIIDNRWNVHHVGTTVPRTLGNWVI